MKKSIMNKLLAVSLMSILAPCAAFATMYVDHFDDPVGGQSLTQTAVGTSASFVSGLGTSAMGGSRYVEVTKTGGSGGSHAIDINNGAYPSVMADSLEAGATGFSRLIWDGNSNNTIEYTMPLIDFTQGGINSAIAIRILFNDQPGNITLNFGDGTVNNNYTLTAPDYYSTFPMDIIIPFSAWTGVDFTQIRGGGMLVDLLQSEDLLIDFVAAVNPVPEPGTLALLGVGMLCLAVYGKRRINNSDNQGMCT